MALYHKIGVKLFNRTCLQSCMRVSIPVIELQEYACPILMYRLKLFFCGFPKKVEVYTNFTIPIFCAS